MNINIKIDKLTSRTILWSLIILTLFTIILSVVMSEKSLITIEVYENCSYSGYRPLYWDVYSSVTPIVQPNQTIEVYTTEQTYYRKCCYPSDCPEAKNNPTDCTCAYAVKCMTDEEYKKLVGS